MPGLLATRICGGSVRMSLFDKSCCNHVGRAAMPSRRNGKCYELQSERNWDKVATLFAGWPRPGVAFRRLKIFAKINFAKAGSDE